MTEQPASDLVRLEINAPETQERIKQLCRYAQVGKCVNGVAHDVNNLLGSAVAYAELLEMEEQLPDDTRDMLEKIISAIEKCSKLVTALTVVARPVTKSVGMIDINAVIRSVLFLREYAHKKAHIEVDLSLHDNLPSLEADGQQLELVLLYLLLNCEEALDRQPSERRITVGSDREAHALIIEINDSGPPIPESQQALLFDAYTSDKAGEHLGLGLVMAREIAEACLGTLEYVTDRGFVLCLPLAQY